MKRIIILCLAAVMLLSGCDILSIELPWQIESTADVTEKDSIVELDIYPENDKFTAIGRFDRVEYNQLSTKQKALYILIDNAMYSMQTGYIELGACGEDDIMIAFHALRGDRPEYFWTPSTYTLRHVGNEYEICFAKTEKDWTYSKKDCKLYKNKIRNILESFLDKVDSDMSEYELELTAHDWLVERITYDTASLNRPDTRYTAWSIAGALVNGKAVCEGYSRAMQLLCFMMGIECGLVTGVTTEAHMWNVVNIDNDWYHVDLTSNDSDDKPYHFFFNVTTEYMLQSRTIDTTLPVFDQSDIEDDRYNVYLPRCTSIEQNYHVKNSLYIGSKSTVESTVVSMICDAVRSGRRSVEFAVSSNIGYVSGEKDAAEFFKLNKCISAANAELSKNQRIYSYSYGGVEGALGFIIFW